MNKRTLMHQFKKLIIEGKKHVVSNSCYSKDRKYVYAGKDKPDWLIWKNRSFKLINDNFAPNSPVVMLARTAIDIETEGNLVSEFYRLRNSLIKALELASENVRYDSYGELKEREPKKIDTINSDNVFISHAASDNNLAIYLKEHIETHFKNAKVFCASYPKELPGKTWSKKIQQALKSSRLFLLIATSRSLERVWVWFECGVCWFQNEDVFFPLCFGEVEKDVLPVPLSEKHGLNMYEENDVKAFFEIMSDKLEKEKDCDIKEFIKDTSKIETDIKNESNASKGWEGVEFDNNFLAYSGPVQDIKMIEDHPYVSEMGKSLERAGYTVNLSTLSNFSDQYNNGYRIIYYTNRSSWRQQLSQYGQYIIAKKNDETTSLNTTVPKNMASLIKHVDEDEVLQRNS